MGNIAPPTTTSTDDTTKTTITASTAITSSTTANRTSITSTSTSTKTSTTTARVTSTITSTSTGSTITTTTTTTTTTSTTKAIIIITGGKTEFGSKDETLVQLFNENGTFICELPKLPENRFGHTQDGLVLCGGGNTSYSIPTCLTFENGSWIESYNLIEPRYLHSSWTSPVGVMLLGGKFFQGNFDLPATSELLIEDGQSVPNFDMHYNT